MVDNTATHSSGHKLAEQVLAGYLTLFLWIKLCCIRFWQSYETNTDNRGGDFIISKDCAKHDPKDLFEKILPQIRRECSQIRAVCVSDLYGADQSVLATPANS